MSLSIGRANAIKVAAGQRQIGLACIAVSARMISFIVIYLFHLELLDILSFH